jgi:hypothetical protein
MNPSIDGKFPMFWILNEFKSIIQLAMGIAKATHDLVIH